MGHRTRTAREAAEFLQTVVHSSNSEGAIKAGKVTPVRPADVTRTQVRVAELKKELDLQQAEIRKLSAGMENC